MSDEEFNRISAMLRKGEHDQALALVTAATRTHPMSPEAWINRAFVEEAMENFVAADSSISRAIELEPGSDLLLKRAGIRMKGGHIRPALADAELAIQSGDAFFTTEARLLAAEAWRRLGEWRRALEVLEDVPDDAEFWVAGMITATEIRTQCTRMLSRRNAA
jgi:tetratricopeptide (TPR) repeat protein